MGPGPLAARDSLPVVRGQVFVARVEAGVLRLEVAQDPRMAQLICDGSSLETTTGSEGTPGVAAAHRDTAGNESLICAMKLSITARLIAMPVARMRTAVEVVRWTLPKMWRDSAMSITTERVGVRFMMKKSTNMTDAMGGGRGGSGKE